MNPPFGPAPGKEPAPKPPSTPPSTPPLGASTLASNAYSSWFHARPRGWSRSLNCPRGCSRHWSNGAARAEGGGSGAGLVRLASGAPPPPPPPPLPPPPPPRPRPRGSRRAAYPRSRSVCSMRASRSSTSWRSPMASDANDTAVAAVRSWPKSMSGSSRHPWKTSMPPVRSPTLLKKTSWSRLTSGRLARTW